MTTPEAVDPIPAADAPHAYVAVERKFSANADRPEWDWNAVVIPEWDHENLEFRRSQGDHLIPIGPDGDTGTRAITAPGPSFVQFTETNDHEGETWTFWLQRDGNEEALNWLSDFLTAVNAEVLDPEYQLFLDKVIPEEHVDVLTKWGGENYMPLHNKVVGRMVIADFFAPDDLYKGDITKLFEAAHDGE